MFWLTINNILNKGRQNQSFPEAFKEDGQTISDKIEIANKFNLYFTNIGINLAQKIKTPANQYFSDYLKTKYNNVLKFKEINTGEIEKTIDNLKAKSSYGWDNISTKLMKSIKTALINPLTIIINQSLKTRIFPDKLKIAQVIPLFKKDDDTVFSNDCPISLLPAISKVFEKAIFIQTYKYFQSRNLFYKNQYGFQRRSFH